MPLPCVPARCWRLSATRERAALAAPVPPSQSLPRLFLPPQILVWKELDYGAMTESEKQMLVSEVNLLRELRHPNIVRYYDRIIDRSSTTLYIVMEYCDGGDLASLIAKRAKERHVKCVCGTFGMSCTSLGQPREKGNLFCNFRAVSGLTLWTRQLFSNVKGFVRSYNSDGNCAIECVTGLDVGAEVVKKPQSSPVRQKLLRAFWL